MKKTVQIVTMPLNKEGWNEGDLLKDDSGNFKLVNHSRFTNVEDWQAQQLLVLSDDEIQKGDWCTMLDSFGNVMLGLPQQYNPSLGHVLNKGLKKTIASYPQLEGTLPISKETVQAWIDAGIPGECSVNLIDDTKFDLKTGWSDVGKTKEEISFLGNLLLEFDKKYKSTGNDLGDLAERAIDKIIANATTKSSIPTDEEISNIASEYAIEKCRIMQQMRCLTARKTAYIDGYKQALKDIGHE